MRVSCLVVSDSARPHGLQPTRSLHPWDSPGKNTGVGFISFSKRNYRKKESEVTQSCLTLCNPMDFSLLGSSIHGMFQARVLEWVAISFSRSHLQSIGNHPLAMNYLRSLRCKIHIFLPRSCNSHPIVASGINTIQFSSIQSFSYVLCPTL